MDSHTHRPTLWHVDEVFIHGMNTEWYLWNVIDHNSRCLAIYLSLYRNTQSAISALRMAKEFAKQTPDIVVSDGYLVYPKAIKKALGKVRHAKAHFKPVLVRHNGFVMAITNNRIEGFNSHLRERVTLLKGFKNYECMEAYLEGFKRIWNSKFLFIIN